MEIDKILCRQNLNEAKNYLEGVLMLVDKPLEWTSFDVVNKIRFAIKYKYGVKKCKVGHAGTLDPLASGLLLICSGSYTKQIDRLQNESKMYSGTIHLGSVTPTYDSESEPVDFKDVPPISDTLLKKIEKQFSGSIQQMPPIYSAIKIKGQKSYDLARRGLLVEMTPRSLQIFDLKLSMVSDHQIYFKVHCSKGTYVRSLAHDIGQFLGCGAYLGSLRRESIADYSVENALSIEETIENIRNQTI
ncbi:MAG: tRNA pseudouridine(55) synthase TruB [Saprospiraceae bacterium]|nr:tRNA pseudouridine(55) synthase TruB [Saprospiraceae bacterium]